MRSHPGHAQEPVRRHPRGTKEAPRRPRGTARRTQEAPRRHTGGTQGGTQRPQATQEAPREAKLGLEGKCTKTIEFFYQKLRNRPFGAGETSPTLTGSLTKYRK